MTHEFWRVYNYVAKNWYELEHGRIEYSHRWYHPAMKFLESLAERESKHR